jgi:hypothetical protein
MKVRCNSCQFVGEKSEFRQGYDLFQNPFVAGCPKCDNSQSPGDASFRMMGGQRPFEYVDDTPEPDDPFGKTLHRARSAS